MEFSFFCLFNREKARLQCNSENIIIHNDNTTKKFKISCKLKVKLCFQNEEMAKCLINDNLIESSFLDLVQLKKRLCYQVRFLGVDENYKEVRVIIKSHNKKISQIQSLITKEYFICKRYSKDQIDENQVEQEIQILRNLRNEKNIVKLIEVYESSNYIYLIMEQLTHKLEKDYTHEENEIIMKEIIEILTILDKNNILHGNIRPINFMFDKKNRIKIIGFCNSKITYDNKELEKQNQIGICRLLLYLYNYEITSIIHEKGIYPFIPRHGTNFLKCLLNNSGYRLSLQQMLSHPYINQKDSEHQIFEQSLCPKFKQQLNKL